MKHGKLKRRKGAIIQGSKRSVHVHRIFGQTTQTFNVSNAQPVENINRLQSTLWLLQESNVRSL